MYRYPATLGLHSAELERRSLAVHSQFYKNSVEVPKPPERRLGRVLAILEKEYSMAKTAIPPDFDTYEGFLRAVSRLERSSTPGYPYNTKYPTIGEYLGFDGILYNDFMLQSLWHDVQSLMHSVDPELFFNVFIKEEPHKREKIESGRFRLIVGSPLHFQVLSHMVFDFLNDVMNSNAYHLPSKQGLILNGGGWRDYVRQWRSKGFNIGLDKRAWDWTVPWWKIKLALELRKRLCYGPGYKRWVDLAEKLYKWLFESPVLMLSDGTCYRQIHPGIVKSGGVNTISDNSIMQNEDHILVSEDLGISCLPLADAVGDDTLQRKTHAVDLSLYEKYGSKVKSASEGLEFVGMKFSERGVFPLYFSKHLYRIPYSKDVIEQYLDAMMRMYVYAPEYEFWKLLASKLGLEGKMRSREYHLGWYEYGYD